MIGFLLMAQAAFMGSQPTAYSCTLKAPIAVRDIKGKQKLIKVELGVGGGLAFKLNTDQQLAKVDWPDTPMNINGSWSLIETGPYSAAFNATADGPCTFADTKCAALVSVSERTDKSLAILIAPSALIKNPDDERYVPFAVSVEGTCTPIEAGK